MRSGVSHHLPIRGGHARVTTLARRSALCPAEPRGAVLPPIAELLGTGVFIFSAVSAIRLTAPNAALSPVNDAVPHGRLLIVGLAVGGSIGLFALTSLARCSGAHLNPAVSLWLWLRRELTSRELALYVAAQILGSLAGVGLARLVWGRPWRAPAPTSV